MGKRAIKLRKTAAGQFAPSIGLAAQNAQILDAQHPQNIRSSTASRAIKVRKAFLEIFRYFATVTGVLLIALLLIAWKHGSMNIFAALRQSLLDTETMLRQWFSNLNFR